MLKKLIEMIVTNLVDQPEMVNVTEVETPEKKIFEIRVAPFDVAKVIGKEERVFKALRGLVASLEPQSRYDIVIDVKK